MINHKRRNKLKWILGILFAIPLIKIFGLNIFKEEQVVSGAADIKTKGKKNEIYVNGKLEVTVE